RVLVCAQSGLELVEKPEERSQLRLDQSAEGRVRGPQGAFAHRLQAGRRGGHVVVPRREILARSAHAPVETGAKGRQRFRGLTSRRGQERAEGLLRRVERGGRLAERVLAAAGPPR